MCIRDSLSVDPYDELRKLSEPAPVEGYYTPGTPWKFVGAEVGCEETRAKTF